MFMASLLFCKSLLECVHALMHVLAECSGCAGNCECVSMNYGEKRSAREVLMILLVLWSVGKPCLLILGPILGEFVLARPPQWTVVFVQVVLNTSTSRTSRGQDETRNHSLHKTGPASENDVQVKIREVEGLVLVMPFALLSASSTWTWVGLRNDGFFAGTRFGIRNCLLAEECSFMKFSTASRFTLCFSVCSALRGIRPSLEDVSLTTLSVTLSLLYFFAYSRSRSQAFAENVFGMHASSEHGVCSRHFPHSTHAFLRYPAERSRRRCDTGSRPLSDTRIEQGRDARRERDLADSQNSA
jgi:hypothetical protein